MTDVREILILILALLIVFSLLRAAYAIHRRGKAQIRISIDKAMIEEAAELDDPGLSELPNGGARVVGEEETGNAATAPTAASSGVEDLLAGENVPLLLDPVVVAPAAESLADGDETVEHGPALEAKPEPELARDPEPEPARKPESQPEPPRQAGRGKETESGGVGADRIIAINVVAGEGREFNGRELWDFLHAAGLRHDEMNILSKTEGNREDGKPIFRVANIVNPGTFDADAIDDFSTPGIGMFMLLPAPINNLLAFEQMLAVARRLAETLDGRLLDSERREMTSRGIERARRRIREFDRETAGSPSVSNQV